MTTPACHLCEAFEVYIRRAQATKCKQVAGWWNDAYELHRQTSDCEDPLQLRRGRNGGLRAR